MRNEIRLPFPGRRRNSPGTVAVHWSSVTQKSSPYRGDAASTDAEDRAALVHNALYDHLRDHEIQFRWFLRNSLLRSLDHNR